MEKTYLIITSIAGSSHPILNQYAQESAENHVHFLLVGDTKSPSGFELDGCDYYSVERQKSLNWELIKNLPFRHYARKNIGYLEAISKGAKVIIETDDDNYPLPAFWESRKRQQSAHLLENKDWVNVYKYFTQENIWPRGFALEQLQKNLPKLGSKMKVSSPIQQGLADENPDVDAIYRLVLPLPFQFDKSESIALGQGAICPFNSQNTTWFQEAFPLLYLPSHCSFRMTDIWRSFVAQRVAWTCDWSVLFHNSTVWQERNDHNLMTDFKDEIPGYANNAAIMEHLSKLDLKEGLSRIPENLLACYKELVDMGLVGNEELGLVKAWLKDIEPFLSINSAGSLEAYSTKSLITKG